MLEIRELHKGYKNKEVLKGISFRCQRGEIVSLLGANGSGKTTLFKTILGLLKPDKGEVLLDGMPLNRKEAGYLPEERSLFQDCTVERQLRLMAAMKGIKKESDEQNIEHWLTRLDLKKYEHKKPFELSKGNQQKVQLAMELISEPSCVIMDEPWTGLDRDNIEIFQKTLLELKRKDCVILLSSHQHQQVQQICDRYLYLQGGKLTINVTREQLRNSQWRIVSVEAEEPFYFADDDILQEYRQSGRISYLTAGERQGYRLMEKLRKCREVSSFALRRININDLLAEAA